MILKYLGILLIVSALLCMVGFYKYVYFLSIGYGFSVAGIGVAIIVFGLSGHLQTDSLVCALCILLVIYGARLSGFLLIREKKNLTFKKKWREIVPDESTIPLPVKFAIWISVSVLYVGQTSPVFFRLYNIKTVVGSAWAGIVICILALILESAADIQKSSQKQQRPDMVAMQGLYKIVRCPNYFGEILFWTGIFVSGLGIYHGVGQWLLAVISYICIIYVMFNGAQRLERRQIKKYGDNEEYHQYVEHTPILIPLIPLYHLNKCK